jgi:hypothetical protein
LLLSIAKEMKMKKFFVFLLSLSICFTPSLVFAGGFNGWTLRNPIAQGASTVYEGLKNAIINGKNVAKTSTAIVTPVAKDVSKVLVRGVAGVALSVAVEGILGSVDWVLDPKNSLIRYTNVPADCLSDNQLCDYKYKALYGNAVFTNAYDACKANVDYYNRQAKLYQFMGAKSSGRNYEIIPGIFAPSVECTIVEIETKRSFVDTIYPVDVSEHVEPEVKTIPLDTVSSKVISNAESGDADAKVATTAASADIVSDAQSDDAKARPIVNQLEANAKTQTDADANTATGETKPNTETGSNDLSLEFPTFCGWAPQVCEAAQTVISFPQTLTNWWETSKQKTDSWASSISEAYTETMEWFQKEPEKDSEGTDVDVEIPEPFDTSVFSKDRFAVSRQCPVPEQHTISLSGVSVNFSFDMTPLCQVLTLARPALVACSYLYAAYIVIGAARNG